MIRLICLLLLLGIYSLRGCSASAQMTLEHCIEYAVENNYRINQQLSSTITGKIDYDEAVLQHLPSLNGGVNGNANFGRGLDPGTNTYVNTSTFNNGISLQLDMPIFSGLRLLNRTRLAKVAKLRGDDLLVQIKDEVALEVMIAYATVLFNSEMVELYAKRIEGYRVEEAKMVRQVELGGGSVEDLAQLRATISTEEYSAIEAENNYDLSVIALKDCMNFPLCDTLFIETSLSSVEIESPTESLEHIIEFALEINPKVAVGSKDLKLKELELKIAKGYYSPTLSLNGGIATSYYTNLGGGGAPFGEQLKNNLGEWVGASLSIPIFNGLSTRKGVLRAKNNLEQAQRDFDEVERQLESEIRRSVMELEAAEKKLQQAKKNLEYQRIANDAAHKRYKLGALSIIELQTSDNDLFRAELELRDSFLRHNIKAREVNYYKGESYY